MIAGCYKKIYQIIKKKFFTVYRLQNKGKKELKKIKNLKNFMKQYTLIYEKDIEYVMTLEGYIPYTLSLGISKKIEEYISNNEKYRNLIYGERS